MRFQRQNYVAPAEVLTREIANLLPDYLPGKDTGPLAITDARSSWIKTAKALLETLGHNYGVDVFVDETTERDGHHQLKVLWKRGDGISLAAISGWGNREELERSFLRLETLKAPQKLLLYTCLRWEEAVVEQLSAAILRYPHHIEGEQYLALNLKGTETQISAYVRDIPRSGILSLSEAMFQPLPGSPFSWSMPNSAVGRR